MSSIVTGDFIFFDDFCMINYIHKKTSISMMLMMNCIKFVQSGGDGGRKVGGRGRSADVVGQPSVHFLQDVQQYFTK